MEAATAAEVAGNTLHGSKQHWRLPVAPAFLLLCVRHQLLRLQHQTALPAALAACLWRCPSLGKTGGLEAYSHIGKTVLEKASTGFLL